MAHVVFQTLYDDLGHCHTIYYTFVGVLELILAIFRCISCQLVLFSRYIMIVYCTFQIIDGLVEVLQAILCRYVGIPSCVRGTFKLFYEFSRYSMLFSNIVRYFVGIAQCCRSLTFHFVQLQSIMVYHYASYVRNMSYTGHKYGHTCRLTCILYFGIHTSHIYKMLRSR